MNNNSLRFKAERCMELNDYRLALSFYEAITKLNERDRLNLQICKDEFDDKKKKHLNIKKLLSDQELISKEFQSKNQFEEFIFNSTKSKLELFNKCFLKNWKLKKKYFFHCYTDACLKQFLNEMGYEVIERKKSSNNLTYKEEVMSILIQRKQFQGLKAKTMKELLFIGDYFCYNERVCFTIYQINPRTFKRWQTKDFLNMSDEEVFKSYNRMNFLIMPILPDYNPPEVEFYFIDNKSVKISEEVIKREYVCKSVSHAQIHNQSRSHCQSQSEESGFNYKGKILMRCGDKQLNAENVGKEYYTKQGFDVIDYASADNDSPLLFDPIYSILSLPKYIADNSIDSLLELIEKNNGIVNLIDGILCNRNKRRVISLRDRKKYECHLKSIIKTLSYEHIVAIITILSFNLTDRLSGWPDLFVWNEKTKEYFFVEVKTETDNLSTIQKYWILWNNQFSRFKFKILRIKDSMNKYDS